MKVVLKARFNASKQRFEKFSNNTYLAYLPFPEDEDAEALLISLLSKYLGVPASRIEYAGKDSNKDFVFDVN